MQTDTIKIKQAAEIIKNGGLVAFPTETVYGLGANALDEAACGRIYLVKGRPADNPLIVHVNSDFDMERIVRTMPPGARMLMEAFWPGPLTLVLKARPGVFSYGFEDTIAVRVPNHIVARLLIHHSGVPIAAPSANISGRPSPTTVEHVLADLGGKVDMILDGGPCRHGLESTVVDFTELRPKILRPGSVTAAMIEDVIGKISPEGHGESVAPKSPGLKYVHYAPKAKMTLVLGEKEAARARVAELAKQAENPAIMDMERKPEEIAANLFADLRRFDAEGHDEIFAQSIDEAGLGAAIMNRLKKAAGRNILEV
ncbi:MAG: threonylcarbamoyl-AMP synthase [Clostridiales bacterium]|nr:threonylcarbamoyl-AMP synthase [Clostridiales bacterium]